MKSWDDIMAEHEQALATAFKVRVRLGECRHMGYWHGTIEDGAVGKIIPVTDPDPDRPSDHTYWVWFDKPIRGRQAWSYSAAELIALTIEDMITEIEQSDAR